MLCNTLIASASLLLTASVVSAQQLDLASSRLVDLTHVLDERTVFWPTATATFELRQIHFGPTPGGFFYADNHFSTPEHGGTHMDAPIHFGEGKRFTHEVPLANLIGPAVVIDVSVKAAADPDYRLSVADVEAFEAAHGQIAAGSIVLLRTGWSERWPDRLKYLGDDTPGDASNLHFPSYGVDAARLLVEERKVGALGVDAASTDYGQSTDFMVHRIMAVANVPGFENLTNLDQLPATGAVIVALPTKIGGGSGAPLRAVAIVPQRR